MNKNIVNKDTIFTKELVKITNQNISGCSNDYGSDTQDFANKTGDSRVNFKVADAIDINDAVNLKQLIEVKKLAFDFISNKEPTNAKQGDIWLDISEKSGCVIKVKVLTPTGSKWLSGLDILDKDLSDKIAKLEKKVIAVFNDSDGRYALKNGSIGNRFNVADAEDKTEAVNLKQLKEVKDLLNVKIDNVDKNKIDKKDTLDRQSILSLIEPLVTKDSLVGPFNIKGKIINADLLLLQDPDIGDIYYVTDENTWAVRLENEWFKDSALINNSKYFTKQQILDLVDVKANKTDLESINNDIEDLKNKIDDLNNNKHNINSRISIVTTEGGSVFTTPLRYEKDVLLDVNTDKKTLVDKEYVDNLFTGITPPVNKPNVPVVTPNSDDVYTKDEVDKILEKYALISNTITQESLDKTLSELFRNRNDFNWKGYKASLQEIVSVLKVEVGDVYGVISLNNPPDIYMFDGDKWISMSSKGTSNTYIGSAIQVINNPAITVSDDTSISIKMCVIPIPIGSELQVIGVYKEKKGKLLSIPFVTSINDNNQTANIYIDSDSIDRVVYTEGNNIPINNPTGDFFKLNEDNTVNGKTTFVGSVIVNTPTDLNEVANKEYVDDEVLKVKGLITASNFEVVEELDIILDNSDNINKGDKMYKIPLLPKTYITILDAYKENTLNNSLDKINIDTIIKDGNLVVYTSSSIKKLVYIKFGIK